MFANLLLAQPASWSAEQSSVLVLTLLPTAGSRGLCSPCWDLEEGDSFCPAKFAAMPCSSGCQTQRDASLAQPDVPKLWPAAMSTQWCS